MRFTNLLSTYENQQSEMRSKIQELENREKTKEDNKKESYKKFFELIEEFDDINELTSELLYKVIDHIEISQGYYEKTKNGKIKKQSIKIFYRFIGNINENSDSIF